VAEYYFSYGLDGMPVISQLFQLYHLLCDSRVMIITKIYQKP